MDVVLDLSKEEAEKLVNDEEYKDKFIEREVNKLKSVIGNPKGDLFCPYCGKEELEVYLDRPFFFSCNNCDKTIFMTDKKIFDDMNRELEEAYEKEKVKTIKETIEKCREAHDHAPKEDEE